MQYPSARSFFPLFPGLPLGPPQPCTLSSLSPPRRGCFGQLFFPFAPVSALAMWRTKLLRNQSCRQGDTFEQDKISGRNYSRYAAAQPLIHLSPQSFNQQIFIKHLLRAFPGTKFYSEWDAMVGKTQFFLQGSYKPNGKNPPKRDFDYPGFWKWPLN